MTDELLRCLAWCGRLLILGFSLAGVSSRPTSATTNLLIKVFDAIGVRIGGLHQANPKLWRSPNMKVLTYCWRRASRGRVRRISFPAVAQRPGDAGGDRRKAILGKAVLVVSTIPWRCRGSERRGILILVANRHGDCRVGAPLVCSSGCRADRSELVAAPLSSSACSAARSEIYDHVAPSSHCSPDHDRHRGARHCRKLRRETKGVRASTACRT